MRILLFLLLICAQCFGASTSIIPSPRITSITAGGGGGGGLPITTNGLVMWFVANEQSLANNDSVTNWSDKTFYANTVGQATAANRPTFKTSVVNSKSAIYFDGVNDCLTNPAVVLHDRFTFFCVYSNSFMFEQGADANSNNGVYHYAPSGNNINEYRSGVLSAGYNIGSVVSNNWKVFVSTYNNTNFYLYNNGVTNGPSTTQTFSPESTVSAQINFMARNQASLFQSGYVAEWGWYTNDLTHANRKTLENYLSTNYNITIAP